METLLSLTLSGSALALLLLFLRLLLRRRLPSGVYYYAWLLVLLRFLLPLPGLIPLGQAAPEQPAAPLPTLRATHYVEAEDTAFPVAALPADPAEAPLPAPETAPDAPADALPETPADGASPAAQAKAGFDWRSPALWLSLWALGAALCFLWPLLSYLRFTAALRSRLREPGETLRALYAAVPGRKPALSLCPGLPTPLMFGVLRPRIVLPAEIDEPSLLRNILRHELCHYRRRDPLYKWFAAAVLSLHWFNPLSWLIRQELNRACELSCDEALLVSMDRAEKQAYGETLLRMAAGSALPAGVVATTFSTEKKNLKERLEQIMHYKKSKGRVLAALLALLLLCGCGAAAGPAGGGTEATIVPREEKVAEVSDVDGLLAAIAPNTTILLAPGEYLLSAASDYGQESQSPYYAWVKTPGDDPDEPSYELQITGVENLILRGAGEGETVLAATPRYANVLRFLSCRELRIEALTAGHTQAPGVCSGGMLRLENCRNVAVDGCGLFGCGTIAVDASECSDLTVTNSHLYECSYSAVSVRQCRQALVEDCEIERNGTKIEGAAAVNLFTAYGSEDFVITGCRIHDNKSQILLNSTLSKGVLFLSNTVEGNAFATTLFQMERYPVTVDGCSFRDNEAQLWVYGGGVFPVDAQGRTLAAADLQAMEYRQIDPATVQAALPAASALELPVGGSVTVTNTDELLAAIGPDRTILLDGALFDLSAASNYGGAGTEYYYWAEGPDGPALIITGVQGLTIRAVSDDPAATTLAAVPRFANVLSFRDCEDIRLVGFTAGHTEEPGTCSGGVLAFEGCHGIELEACRLYGCGILGLDCRDCTGVTARDCEIYDCSQGGVTMWRTDGVRFLGCDIHDVPSPALLFRECGDLSWNDTPVSGEKFDLGADGSLQLLAAEQGAASVEIYPENLYPFELLPPRDFREGEATDEALAFARSVQQNIAEGNWEALSKQLYYPFHILTGTKSIDALSPEDFLALDLDTLLPPEFRQKIADAPLDAFGATLFGNSFCGGYLAFGQDRTAEEPPLLRLTAISLAVPMPDNRIPEGLLVYHEGRQLTEFTLHQGDSVTLAARVYPLGLFPDAEIRWTVSDPQALGLTPSPDGRRCQIEALQSAPGGVKLTAEFQGVRWQMTVYLPGAQPAPTPAP